MIGRHMPDETNPRYGRLRAFVDGPASEGMIQDRFDAKLRLAPHGERWATDASRVVLCDAAFESGYDAAVIHAKSVIGDLVERAGKVRIRRNKHGKFRIWERPDEDESYFVCVDSGGGKNERQKKEKKDPDPTCIEVWNHRTGAQAAQWHGHIAYDLIADVVELAGRLFGRATACVELQNHGYTVVADLKRKSYPMYQWKPDEPGWSTNTKTKPLMVDDLYRMSRDGLVHIRNKATVSEMRTFIEENGKYNSASGCHDERVDTAGMATQMMSLMPSALSQESASVFWNNIEKRSTKKSRDFQEVYTHH